jgi:hypothetical protein
MAETYGYLPTEVLDQPASDFWLNASIRHATEQFKNDMEQQARQGQTQAGVASPAEKNELVQDNDARAEQREDLDGGQPALADQLDALQDIDRGP